MHGVRLQSLMQEKGKTETYSKGDIFYSLDFKEMLYMASRGFVKRYQVKADKRRVIESIYGPGYLFPLSQVYKKILHFDLSQENIAYIYEAMTDVDLQSIGISTLEEALQDNPELNEDLLYEAGRRLKANINRLASNALDDDYQKIAHQLVCLADEFGEPTQNGNKEGTEIPVSLKPIDMSEQLNISKDVTDAVMNRLEKQGLLKSGANSLVISDINLLKDVYL